MMMTDSVKGCEGVVILWGWGMEQLLPNISSSLQASRCLHEASNGCAVQPFHTRFPYSTSHGVAVITAHSIHNHVTTASRTVQYIHPPPFFLPFYSSLLLFISTVRLHCIRHGVVVSPPFYRCASVRVPVHRCNALTKCEASSYRFQNTLIIASREEFKRITHHPIHLHMLRESNGASGAASRDSTAMFSPLASTPTIQCFGNPSSSTSTSTHTDAPHTVTVASSSFDPPSDGAACGGPSIEAGDGAAAVSVNVNGSTQQLRMSKYAEMVGHKSLAILESCGKVEGLFHALQSDATSGISGSTVTSRRAIHGSNRLPAAETQTLWEMIKESFQDRTLQVLIGAAVVSLVLGMTTPDPRTGEVDRTTGWIEGFAILLSVGIVVLVSSFNNFQKQEQFTQLMEEGSRLHDVMVLRDGEWRQVRNEDVVVGDVVLIQQGAALSFDAVLYEGEDIVCDEMSVTGERGEVHKHVATDPFLISGTSVAEGDDAKALVVAVGEGSFSGVISMAVREGKKDTPLQEQLEAMAEIIGKFGLGAALFTFGVLFLKELYVILVLQGRFYAMKLFDNITTAVAIVVVAVPEGLPLSVTISLAYSMRRMLSDGNLVRHLAACETMGGATVLCTDKTGTLTEPNMSVTNVYLEGKLVTCGAGFSRAEPTLMAQNGCSETGIRYLLDAIALTAGCRRLRHSNTKTSEALAVLSCRNQALQHVPGSEPYDADEAAERVSSQPHGYRRYPFSSIRKQSSALVRSGGGAHAQDRLVHYVCGAAEVVLSKCNSCLSHNGVRVLLSPDLRKQHEQVITDFTKHRGLRTLCVAFSEKLESPTSSSTDALTSVHYAQPPQDALTLVAIVGLEEPIRHDVPEAVRMCKRAGMSVIVVTGDGLNTATHIAQRCNIIEQHSYTIDGPTFRSMSDEEIVRTVLPNLAVLARATPLDKQRLVHLLKRDPSHVVAVTGDGTNDAPALKAADVGFSMNSGSDTAKRASDIVLLQDNFSGMVKAAMWGRNVRENIRKFLQFQLTVNSAACIIAFFGAVMNSQNLSPLKPVQLLWLNIIMDTFAALALATELPCERLLLSRGPEPKGSAIITKAMWWNIFVQSALQLAVQLYLLAHGHKTFRLEFFGPEHLTIVFNAFVWLQVFNFFNARLLTQGDARLLDNLGSSAALLKIVAAIIVTQVLMVEFGGKFMSTTPLTMAQWAYCIVMGMSSLVVGTFARAAWQRQLRTGRDIPIFSSLYRKVDQLQKQKA